MWTRCGGILAGLAVAFGAFAAHGLDHFLVEKYSGETRTVAGQEMPASAKYLGDFKTGAAYQMYHALGLVAIGLMLKGRPSLALNIAAWSFVVGILLFSGSLYVLVLGGPRWLGLVAAVGGTSFLIGWTAFAIGASGASKGR